MFGVKIGPLQAGNWTISNVGVLCFDLNGVNCNYIQGVQLPFLQK